MTVECACCGAYEVGECYYQDLFELPDDHWQIRFLQKELRQEKGIAVITKPNNAAFRAGPMPSRLTKLQKRSLRRKSERKQQVVVQVLFRGNDDQGDA